MAIRQAWNAALDRIRVGESRGNSLNNPSVPLSAAGFLSWVMGGEPTASGEQVTLNTALQQTTVYACVRVLAESISSLPMYVYEVTNSGRKKTFDHTLSDLLRWEPNDEMTSVTMWECMVGAMALAGNGYIEIQRDNGGRVVALWPLHPQLTEPKRDRAGNLTYQTTDGMTDGKERLIPSENMLHCPLFSLQGLKGFSPIHLARQGIGLARASEKYGAKFFGNGGRPSGVLSSTAPLTPKQIDEMKISWNQAQAGDASQSTAVLPGQWSYQQIGLSPEESQFLATRQLQRAEIAAIFRVPPHMVGDTSRLSNNNHEQMGLSFVTDTLRPYLARIEAEMMRKLLPNLGRNAGRYELEFDVSERLRGDFKTTMDGYAVGKQWGFFNTNYVLRKLDENEIGPVGDIYWAPVNMQNAARLLNTESVQDQPVGADPNNPDGGDDPPKEGQDDPKPPTKAERDLLGRYTRGYITVFRDGFQRLLRRDKRDLEAVSALLGPILSSISEAASERAPVKDEARAGIVSEVLLAIQKRAAKWPAQPSDDEVMELARIEFVKSIRSIHINITREWGASLALQQLETE